MKRLYRSTQDSMISGICGGLGEYFTIDPTIIRLGMLFASAVGMAPAILIAYIAGTIIIPEDSGYEIENKTEKEEKK